MSRVRVKICGITSDKDLNMAVEAGADAVGFVVDVPASPRSISIDEAAKLIENTPVFVEAVVVTAPKNLNHLEKICKEVPSKTIQIHGLSHMHKMIRRMMPDKRLIGAMRIDGNRSIDSVLEISESFDAVLLDTYMPGRPGGTGKTHDWNISRRVRDAVHPKPLILAGGLNPSNVKDAIETVRPYAVDVSSGVESKPGVKDQDKICELIKRVREAEV